MNIVIGEQRDIPSELQALANFNYIRLHAAVEDNYVHTKGESARKSPLSVSQLTIQARFIRNSNTVYSLRRNLNRRVFAEVTGVLMS